MKYIFIINPAAGREDSTPALKKTISSVFERRGLSYEVYLTVQIGDATRFVQEYPTEDSSLTCCFIACGGDGTLNEVVSGAVGKPNTVVGVLPCGTGNDFIRSFGTMETFANLHNLLGGTVHPIDLMLCGNRYAINLCNIGFDAEVSRNVSVFRRIPLLSSVAYHCSLLYSLAGKRHSTMTILFDNGETVTMPFLLVAAANGISYGGGYRAAPKALVDDGYIDFCGIKKIPLHVLARVVGIYKKGKHLEDETLQKHLVYRRCKSVTVSSSETLTICIDGEIITGNSITIANCKHALNFLIPHGGHI